MQSYDYKKWAFIAGTVALFTVAFAALVFGFTTWRTSNLPAGQVPTISVFGEGEVNAAPDIATVMFAIRESAKTVPEAQKLVEDKMTAALAELSKLSIEKKDTKTTSYTVNPKYEYGNVTYPAIGAGSSAYMPTEVRSTQKLVGYEVAQSVTVKVRNIDSAGDAIGALGKVSITEISGPDFTIDDLDKAQADAKELAIKEAREKAEKTARSLGLSLGSVVSFTDDNGYYPMYYARDSVSMAYGKGGTAPESVSLPQGESIIKVRVTITYSLR